jgi:hypothetical protein
MQLIHNALPSYAYHLVSRNLVMHVEVIHGTQIPAAHKLNDKTLKTILEFSNKHTSVPSHIRTHTHTHEHTLKHTGESLYATD